MSLRAWLKRRFPRLSGFCRWLWLERADGLAQAKRPRSTLKPRPSVRLEIQTLELRETPDDLFGLLAGGMALGGLALMGPLDTPLTALLAQDIPQPKVLPSGVIVPLPSQNDLPQTQASRDPAELLTGSRPVQETQPARPQQPMQREALASGFVDSDWLAELGTAFDQPRQRGSRLGGDPADSAPPPNGGGGGGGGDGSGSGAGTQGGFGGFGLSGAGVGQPQDIVTASAMAGVPQGGAEPAGAEEPAGDTGGTFFASSAQGGGPEAGAGERAVRTALAGGFGRGVLAFEMNVGQSASGVTFLSRGPGFGFWLKGDELVFATPRPSVLGQEVGGRDVFRMRLVGANPNAEVVGRDPLHQRTNYFKGDPAAWHANVPNFARVEVREAFAGVDLVLRSRTAQDRVFEHDFVVKPSGSVESIRVRWEGLLAVGTDLQGRLLLQTAGRTVIQDAPVLYQESHGVRTTVTGRYVLRAGNEVGFEVTGEYDRTRPLVIDPAISFATYLGGSGDDKAYALAVDVAGNSYVTGSTASSGFPTQDGYDPSYNTNGDVFVSKLSAAGNELVYSTFIGGTSSDEGRGIALDASGAAYVTGTTASSGFPTTAGAAETNLPGSTSAFLAKLAPAGDALLYSTFVNGNSTTTGAAVAVDRLGRAYVVGTRGSTALIVQIDAAATTLINYTVNPNGAWGNAVAVARSGETEAVYVAGGATSTNVVSGSVYQSTLKGPQDAFLMRLNTSMGVQWATLLGGNGTDEAFGVAAAPDSLVPVVVGKTTGGSSMPPMPGLFPTTAGAAQTTYGGGAYDGFVTSFNTSGSALGFSTFLGGNADDQAKAVAVAASGRVTVGGSTAGGTAPGAFPVSGNAFQGTFGGGTTDGFVARLNSGGGSWDYVSFHGGGGVDEARGVGLDPRGDAYLAGYTDSTNLATSAYAYQVSNAGGYDAFVAKILPRPNVPTITTITDDNGYSSSDRITNDQTLNIVGRADPSVTVTLERVGVGVLGDVAAHSSGLWTYNYTGTSLSEGSHAFRARAKDSSLVYGDFSAETLVHVDLTAPSLALTVPTPTTSRSPQIQVTASDTFGLAATATVTLDVDLNNDNDFGDATETGYTSGNLSNGQVTITLPTLSGTGTYRVQARVTDLAGNQATSSASSFTVSAVGSAWVATSQVVSVDPAAGTFGTVLGDVSVAHGLDLDQSPGTQQGGSPALVYHSSAVSVKPFVQVTMTSDNASALPTMVEARLTFNGTAAATVTYSTTGFSPGDVFTLSLQASNAITTTGRYGYSVLVKIPGQTDQTLTGSTYVVAQDASPLGAGWTFAGVDRLHSISSDANGPAGQLRVYGTGGWRFYEGTTTFTSPAGDSGTLTTGGGLFTYTMADGQTQSFNSSGYLTKWTSADAQEVITYSYDGSNRLSGIAAVDGALATFTYTGSTTVGIETANSRRTTLTLSSGDLTKVTNPDGGVHTFVYDGSTHRMTQEQFGPSLENNFAYTSAGTLGTVTWGATSVGGVTNLSRTVLAPVVAQGLSALVAGTTVYARTTDPLGGVTRTEHDERGRVKQVVSADGAHYQYGYSNGYLTKETDPLGRVTTFTRDGSGYVTKTELPDASVLTYQYQTAFHALTTMIDERGNTTTMGYDGSGHLTRRTDALGNATVYNYTAGGLLESVVDPLGNRTSYTYDGSRRLSTVKDALTRVTTTTYDSNGNVRTTVDALGRTTTYTNDALGRTTATTDAQGNVYTATYDGAGLALTTTNPLLAQTSTVYDRFKRGLASQSLQIGTGLQLSSLSTFDDAGRAISSRNAAGWSGDASYDILGRATGGTDALGGTTKSVYDLAGQVLASRDEMGRWATYLYDARGRQTRATDALGNMTTTAYDKAGNVTETTDALGRLFTTTYDAVNRATGTLDALLRRTTTTFDAAGNVLTSSDHKGNVTSYAYDALNRQTKATMAVGSSVQVTTETSYDEVGNTKTTKDGLGNVTSYLYDTLNRRTETIDPLAHRTTTTYNAVGNVSSVKDALGKLVTYSYDGLNRQVAVKNPLGNLSTVVLDALGRTAASMDPLGNVQQSAFDPLGRGVGSLDSRGGFTIQSPDATGGQRGLSDPVENVWRYEVDGLGRETVRIDPAGARTTTTYDAVGRVSTVTDRLGQVTVNGYDAGDRLATVTWKSAAGATVNLLTYTYDDNSNLLTAKDYNGTLTYTYDELNRAKTYANVFGQTLTYTYDGNDRVTKREDSLGGLLTSVYDNHGRLTSRQFTGTGSTGTAVRIDFGYSDRDEQGSVTWYSNIAGSTVIATSSYSRDDAGRLTSIVNKDSAAATLSYYNYSHDAADRVSVHSWWSQVGTVTYSATKTYTYDSTSQLTDDSTTAYSYDLNGNRTMAGYATGTANRLSNDGTYTYTYDASGRMTQQSKGASLETWFYTYDHHDRLTNVRKTSDGSTNLLLVTYTYDVESKRVKEEEWVSGGGGAGETRFAYDGAHAWADLDSGNAALVRRNFGDAIDQVLTRTVASGGNAGVWLYATDNLGSVRDLVNSSAQVKDHLDYTGFGVITESHSTVGDRYTYTGRELNKNSGLQDNWARAYKLSIGRWMREDPRMFQGRDMNLYRRVSNNTTNAKDLSGLIWFQTDNTVTVDLGADVGSIEFSSEKHLMSGEFIIAPKLATDGLKVDGVAKKLGGDYFNWYQIMTKNTRDGFVKSDNKTKLKAPFVDPAPGGYGDSPTTKGDDTVWADNLPWYYNMGKVPRPRPKGYKDVHNLDTFQQETKTSMMFADAPGVGISKKDEQMHFKVWLVLVKKDGKLVKIFGGVSWESHYTAKTNKMTVKNIKKIEPISVDDMRKQNKADGFDEKLWYDKTLLKK